MAGEALIARGIGQAGSLAGRTALAEEAAVLMSRGGKSVGSAVAVVDEASTAVINAIKTGDRSKALGAWFEHLSTPTSRETMVALDRLPVESMKPEAFKVLTVDGFSPNFGKGLNWSLPKMQDGKWVPGAWMDVSNKPMGMSGLYIADDAERWLRYYGKPGRSALTAYRVQIGDPVSRYMWNNPLPGLDLGNFSAKTVRLLEPLR